MKSRLSMAKTSTKTKAAQPYSKELLLHWYEEMMLQRRFEEKASQMYMQQKIKGFCHLYIGQEAVSSGIESAIHKDDYLITAYRDHGMALTRGVSANQVMAEMYGKRTGSSKGKGGSMHMFSKEHYMLGGHGIVGAHIPLGAGFAFASKYTGDGRISVCAFGDGAARQGALHEAFNLAMTWKLPVIYVVENNEYAMGTSVERTSNVTELYKLGLAYDMPSWQVDGMSVMAVYEEMKKAVELVRTPDHGPVFLEMKTYRYKGHSMSDPAKYRTKEELEHFKNEDPILEIRAYIYKHDIATPAELEAIEARIEVVVEESVKFAEESPYPDASELYEDVYHTPNYPYIRL
ncbi:MAG: pyruvate dehydrogenase (acetyl-transferring) component subunit alpha [Bacteroidota bacterium]|jgi:pyruvate dehydrogenase E1 component alpha subunit